MYSKKVMKHFLRPKFFGRIKNPDSVGEVGNVRCGDVMKLYLKIDGKKGVIKDIKFETLGCGAAIASSDMVCEMVKGKKLEQAKNLKFQDILKNLGDLPPVKIHCSVLATQALRKAIEKYEIKKGKKQ